MDGKEEAIALRELELQLELARLCTRRNLAIAIVLLARNVCNSLLLA